MAQQAFLERLRSGQILVSDGATGSNLQQRGLGKGISAEAWVLEQPEQILRLHRDFLAAGADILLTCTFGGTSLRLQHAGLASRAEEINRRAAALAKQAAGDKALVAGSIGPTGLMLQPFGPLSESEAQAAFAGPGAHPGGCRRGPAGHRNPVRPGRSARGAAGRALGVQPAAGVLLQLRPRHAHHDGRQAGADGG